MLGLAEESAGGARMNGMASKAALDRCLEGLGLGTSELKRKTVGTGNKLGQTANIVAAGDADSAGTLQAVPRFGGRPGF